MKLSYLFLLSFILFLQATAQDTWQKVLGTKFNDYAVQMIATNDGGYMLLGYNEFTGNAKFNRVYLIKTSAKGEVLWEKIYPLTGYANVIPNGICKGNDNDYWICGKSVVNGWYFPLLLKVDDLGNIKLLKGYGKEVGYEFRGIACTITNQLFVNNYYRNNEHKICLLNTNGDVVWGRDSFNITVTSPLGKNFGAIGYKYIAGKFYRRLSIFDTLGNYLLNKPILPDSTISTRIIFEASDKNMVVIGNKGYSIAFIKLNSNGDTLQTNIVLKDRITIPYDVKQDKDGNYILLTQWRSDYSPDFQILKLDKNGRQFSFHVFVRGKFEETPRSLIVAQDDNYVLFGDGEEGPIGLGGNDMIFAKCDTAGGIATMGIYEGQKKEVNQFVLFPNPAENTITLQSAIPFKGMATIHNSEGKVIDKIHLRNTEKNTLDISHLPSGHYYMHINNQSNTFTETHPFLKP